MPTFELTTKQVQLRNAAAGQARHILAYGGSRSGKTFGFCYCIAKRAFMAPNSRHLIARFHNIDVRQAVQLDTWPKMMRLAFPGVPYEDKRGDQFVLLPNGSEIWFGGLDDKERVEKILGKEYATIYFNEASQISYDTVLSVRTRLAMTCVKDDGRPLPLKAYYDLNPTGRGHWSYKEFVEGVRPENGLPLMTGVRAHVVLNPLDNPHLPKEYLEELDALPTRQRQRFYEGAYVSEIPGALWTSETLDACRVSEHPPLVRVVVGVDPSGSDGKGAARIETDRASQGIVVAGIDAAGHAYVLEDGSCNLSPAGWGQQVIDLYRKHLADKIVAEANFGGAMVASTIRTADKLVPIRMVTASRGKHIRAEPVAALYEQGRVHHLGRFPKLEEQMGMMTTAGYKGGESPDRLDACVWALTDLMLSGSRAPLIAVPGIITGARPSPGV